MWQKVVREKMKALGFRACVTVPCLDYHQDRDVFVVVHVDDLCSGEGDLAWFRGELENSFELKSQVVGPGSSATYLGRRISWDEDGISIEGEDKYIQKILKEWQLERCTSLSTPGCDENKRQGGGNEALDDKSATMFRRSAAMLNYMAQDRPDLSFASEEVSGCKAKPTQKDVVKLKRIIQYLSEAKRMHKYKWQSPPKKVVAYCDSDWAGCTQTRKSTSGGVLMHGSHSVHHKSSTQKVVA